MATIEVPDSMVPEGWEIAGEFREAENGDYWLFNPDRVTSGRDPLPRLILRRKPVLDHVVLRVTGPRRSIKTGEYYLDDSGNVSIWSFNGPTVCHFIPLSAPEQVTK